MYKIMETLVFLFIIFDAGILKKLHEGIFKDSVFHVTFNFKMMVLMHNNEGYSLNNHNWRLSAYSK